MAFCWSGKEIITLQLGTYSNFVGAHYWNLQEALHGHGILDRSTKYDELDHDILFRKGFNRMSGQGTSTPRVIAFDFSKNCKSFAAADSISPDEVQDALIWDGTVERCDRSLENSTDKDVYTESSIAGKHSSLNKFSDQTVSTWSDYALTDFHEKSLFPIKRLHNEACGGSFENFCNGEVLFKIPKIRDDFESTLHFFIEECDSLQGFQVRHD